MTERSLYSQVRKRDVNAQATAAAAMASTGFQYAQHQFKNDRSYSPQSTTNFGGLNATNDTTNQPNQYKQCNLLDNADNPFFQMDTRDFDQHGNQGMNHPGSLQKEALKIPNINSNRNHYEIKKTQRSKSGQRTNQKSINSIQQSLINNSINTNNLLLTGNNPQLTKPHQQSDAAKIILNEYLNQHSELLQTINNTNNLQKLSHYIRDGVKSSTGYHGNARDENNTSSRLNQINDISSTQTSNNLNNTINNHNRNNDQNQFLNSSNRRNPYSVNDSIGAEQSNINNRNNFISNNPNNINNFNNNNISNNNTNNNNINNSNPNNNNFLQQKKQINSGSFFLRKNYQTNNFIQPNDFSLNNTNVIPLNNIRGDSIGDDQQSLIGLNQTVGLPLKAPQKNLNNSQNKSVKLRSFTPNLRQYKTGGQVHSSLTYRGNINEKGKEDQDTKLLPNFRSNTNSRENLNASKYKFKQIQSANKGINQNSGNNLSSIPISSQPNQQYLTTDVLSTQEAAFKTENDIYTFTDNKFYHLVNTNPDSFQNTQRNKKSHSLSSNAQNTASTSAKRLNDEIKGDSSSQSSLNNKNNNNNQNIYNSQRNISSPTNNSNGNLNNRPRSKQSSGQRQQLKQKQDEKMEQIKSIYLKNDKKSIGKNNRIHDIPEINENKSNNYMSDSQKSQIKQRNKNPFYVQQLSQQLEEDGDEVEEIDVTEMFRKQSKLQQMDPSYYNQLTNNPNLVFKNVQEKNESNNKQNKRYQNKEHDDNDTSSSNKQNQLNNGNQKNSHTQNEQLGIIGQSVIQKGQLKSDTNDNTQEGINEKRNSDSQNQNKNQQLQQTKNSNIYTKVIQKISSNNSGKIQNQSSIQNNQNGIPLNNGEIFSSDLSEYNNRQSRIGSNLLNNQSGFHKPDSSQGKQKFSNEDSINVQKQNQSHENNKQNDEQRGSISANSSKQNIRNLSDLNRVNQNNSNLSNNISQQRSNSKSQIRKRTLSSNSNNGNAKKPLLLTNINNIENEIKDQNESQRCKNKSIQNQDQTSQNQENINKQKDEQQNTNNTIKLIEKNITNSKLNETNKNSSQNNQEIKTQSSKQIDQLDVNHDDKIKNKKKDKNSENEQIKLNDNKNQTDSKIKKEILQNSNNLENYGDKISLSQIKQDKSIIIDNNQIGQNKEENEEKQNIRLSQFNNQQNQIDKNNSQNIKQNKNSSQNSQNSQRKKSSIIYNDNGQVLTNDEVENYMKQKNQKQSEQKQTNIQKNKSTSEQNQILSESNKKVDSLFKKENTKFQENNSNLQQENLQQHQIKDENNQNIIDDQNKSNKSNELNLIKKDSKKDQNDSQNKQNINEDNNKQMQDTKVNENNSVSSGHKLTQSNNKSNRKNSKDEKSSTQENKQSILLNKSNIHKDVNLTQSNHSDIINNKSKNKNSEDLSQNIENNENKSLTKSKVTGKNSQLNQEQSFQNQNQQMSQNNNSNLQKRENNIKEDKSQTNENLSQQKSSKNNSALNEKYIQDQQINDKEMNQTDSQNNKPQIDQKYEIINLTDGKADGVVVREIREQNGNELRIITEARIIIQNDNSQNNNICKKKHKDSLNEVEDVNADQKNDKDQQQESDSNKHKNSKHKQKSAKKKEQNIKKNKQTNNDDVNGSDSDDEGDGNDQNIITSKTKSKKRGKLINPEEKEFLEDKIKLSNCKTLVQNSNQTSKRASFQNNTNKDDLNSNGTDLKSIPKYEYSGATSPNNFKNEEADISKFIKEQDTNNLLLNEEIKRNPQDQTCDDSILDQNNILSQLKSNQGSLRNLNPVVQQPIQSQQQQQQQNDASLTLNYQEEILKDLDNDIKTKKNEKEQSQLNKNDQINEIINDNDSENEKNEQIKENKNQEQKADEAQSQTQLGNNQAKKLSNKYKDILNKNLVQVQRFPIKETEGEESLQSLHHDTSDELEQIVKVKILHDQQNRNSQSSSESLRNKKIISSNPLKNIEFEEIEKYKANHLTPEEMLDMHIQTNRKKIRKVNRRPHIIKQDIDKLIENAIIFDIKCRLPKNIDIIEEIKTDPRSGELAFGRESYLLDSSPKVRYFRGYDQEMMRPCALVQYALDQYCDPQIVKEWHLMQHFQYNAQIEENRFFNVQVNTQKINTEGENSSSKKNLFSNQTETPPSHNVFANPTFLLMDSPLVYEYRHFEYSFFLEIEDFYPIDQILLNRFKERKIYEENELLFIFASLIECVLGYRAKNICLSNIQVEHVAFCPSSNSYKFFDLAKAQVFEEQNQEKKYHLYSQKIYQAPELQAENMQGDGGKQFNLFSADLYSLGITLLCFKYHMISNNRTANFVQNRIEMCKNSMQLSGCIINYLLEEDPKQRVSNMHKIQRELHEHLKSNSDNLQKIQNKQQQAPPPCTPNNNKKTEIYDNSNNQIGRKLNQDDFKERILAVNAPQRKQQNDVQDDQYKNINELCNDSSVISSAWGAQNNISFMRRIKAPDYEHEVNWNEGKSINNKQLNPPSSKKIAKQLHERIQAAQDIARMYKYTFQWEKASNQYINNLEIMKTQGNKISDSEILRTVNQIWQCLYYNNELEDSLHYNEVYFNNIHTLYMHDEVQMAYDHLLSGKLKWILNHKVDSSQDFDIALMCTEQYPLDKAKVLILLGDFFAEDSEISAEQYYKDALEILQAIITNPKELLQQSHPQSSQSHRQSNQSNINKQKSIEDAKATYQTEEDSEQEDIFEREQYVILKLKERTMHQLAVIEDIQMVELREKLIFLEENSQKLSLIEKAKIQLDVANQYCHQFLKYNEADYYYKEALKCLHIKEENKLLTNSSGTEIKKLVSSVGTEIKKTPSIQRMQGSSSREKRMKKAVLPKDENEDQQKQLKSQASSSSQPSSQLSESKKDLEYDIQKFRIINYLKMNNQTEAKQMISQIVIDNTPENGIKNIDNILQLAIILEENLFHEYCLELYNRCYALATVQLGSKNEFTIKLKDKINKL